MNYIKDYQIKDYKIYNEIFEKYFSTYIAMLHAERLEILFLIHLN